ncbi:MAG: acyltransferase family protein [Candidatus Nanopelagicales bacterium]|nr:acyltransferase family protein [Candidatus Nanopelagicales bacterium]
MAEPAESKGSARPAQAQPWHMDRGRASGEMGYLPGLDGIRAIAVLGVLLYHADVGFLPGGFLGVDVFFVLSGFLITTLLLEQFERTGTVAFTAFYLGRVRRLFPALVALLIVVAIASAVVYRDAAQKTASDLIASFLYVNNWWYVVAEQSYFDFIARPPLLKHLWSLSIEEQFYFVWPVIAFVLMRTWRRRGVLIGSLALALASTLWMLVLANANGFPELADPSRVYFGTDSHAMGLLVGAALATVWRPGRMPAHVNRTVRDGLTVIGVLALGALAAFYVGIGELTPWLYRGGFLGLALIVGLIIVIASQPGTNLGRVLGTQPWRYIGQRSYGLYLWHWPIFAVTRPELDTPLDGLPLLVVRLALTFAVAEASYRWLEMPIRRGALARLRDRLRDHQAPDRRPLMARVAAAAVLAVLVLAGTGVALGAAARTDQTPADVVAAIGTKPSVEIERVAPPSAKPSSVAKPSGAQPSVAPGSVAAIGDSVMLGARAALYRAMPGIEIDAAVARFPGGFLGPMRRYERAHALAPVVVLHPGTNGTLSASMLRAMLTIVRTHDRVVVVNDNVPRSWRDSNNAVIAAVVPEFPNAVMVDWRSASKDRPEWFVSDRVHLTRAGARAYARLIRLAAVGG